MESVDSNLRGLERVVSKQLSLLGWSKVKPGSYCKGRILARTQSVMVSAALLNPNEITKKDYELNVIVTRAIQNPTATIALLRVEGKKPKELYRIDYNNKHGWHLDSKYYGGIKHLKLGDVNSWEEVVLKVDSLLEDLPLDYPAISDKFTDPENHLRLP